MTALVVAGTDTGVGKTVVAAMLTLALEGVYWKPVQAGTRQGTDAAMIAALTGLGPERFIPERYRLTEPLSPHRAAELDGVAIDADSLVLPAETQSGHPLIIEGAGGLMVPLTRRTLYVEVFQRWRVPVVLCARTALGTINHSLLSIEALRTRCIPIVGIVFIGDPRPDSQRTICDFAQVHCVGHLPWLSELTPGALAAAFASHFDPEPFRAVLGR